MNALFETVVYWIHLSEHTDYHTQGYVGVSKNLKNRKANHFGDLSRNIHTNPHLTHAFKKYSWEKFIFDIVLAGKEDFCYKFENTIRPKKNIGWNIAIGGLRGPGWPKGRKHSAESVAKGAETRKKNRWKIEARQKARHDAKLLQLAENKQFRADRKAKKKENCAVAAAVRRVAKKYVREVEERKKVNEVLQAQSTNNTNLGIKLADSTMRPICPVCNYRFRAINCWKNGKPLYRGKCGFCIKNKISSKPLIPRWELDGYKKKMVCDRCNFRAKYASQTLVYHVDGNLNNTSSKNLKTICRNCVEEIAKSDLPWRAGDLTPDR